MKNKIISTTIMIATMFTISACAIWGYIDMVEVEVVQLEATRIPLAQASYTDFIVIDQFGYRPDARKTAVIRNPIRGIDSYQYFSPGEVYRVVCAEAGDVVFEGAPVHMFEICEASGDEIWWFDFSPVTQPGRFYVLDAKNNVRSFSFAIVDDVYAEVLRHAVRMFFYQRSGHEKLADFAGEAWADEASHLQDMDSRLFSDPDNEYFSRDLHGGWYDAGDYNKYTAWTADYVAGLLEIYRARPEIFTDDFNIPESGNGVPDILDEARWGMDFLLRLQNDGSINFINAGIPGYPTDIDCFDGSLLSIVGYGDSGNSPPSADDTPSRYGPPNTIATISGARAFAVGAVVFAEYDPEYAAILKDAAIRAYEWVARNPEVFFVNNTAENNSRGLGAGNQEPEADGYHSIRPRLVMRMRAGFYLYELTGDVRYLQAFEQDGAYRSLPLFQWGNMDMYRFCNHMMYLHYLTLEGANPEIAEAVRAQLAVTFTRDNGHYAARLGTHGYLAYMEHYNWGSNNHISNVGVTFYYFAKHDIVPGRSDEFRNAAEDYLRYLHGVNPLNTVFLTNMNDYGASRSLTAIFHSWFSVWGREGVSDAGPPPGFLAGGANQWFNVQSGFPTNLGGYEPTPQELALGLFIQRQLVGSPPAKMYMDIDDTWPINSWEISEPMGYYQVAYIRLLSKFVNLP